MKLLPYPAQIATQSVDLTPLQTAIAQLQSNENVDDATVAALDAAVKTITVGTAIAENQPIRELVTPAPAVIGTWGTGTATLVANAVGSHLVNANRVHTVARTTGSDPVLTWELSSAIPIAYIVGGQSISFRFGIPTAATISPQLTLGGVTTTFSKVAGSWVPSGNGVTAYVDGSWTWFAVIVPTNTVSVPFKLNLPPGQVLLPCAVTFDAVTSLQTKLSGMRLIDSRSGDFQDFKPGTLALKTEIPPTVSIIRVVAMATDSTLGNCLGYNHPSGGTFRQFLANNHGEAVDLIIQGGQTGSSVKQAFGWDARFFPVLVAGGSSTLPGDNDPIPSGMYRVWQTDPQIWLRLISNNTDQSAAIATLTNTVNTLSARLTTLTTQTVTQASAGVAVAVGDRLRVQISTTGNRSLQISASTATNVTCDWASYNSVENGTVANWVTGQALTTAWVYVNSGLTFSRQCDTQAVIIRDNTNNRRYRVDMSVGNTYANSLFVVQELS